MRPITAGDAIPLIYLKGLKLESDEAYKEHLNRYDVIFLNMQQFLIEADSGKVTEYLEQEVLRELRKEYGEILDRQNIGLAASLREIFVQTGRQFIFLIDEWDCVMRERQESEPLQKQYLDFLRNLLKDQIYVALAYMTGILPVKKYGLHSALNMFAEYSMTKSWYDGYQLTRFRHIYNPKSVVEAMRRHKFSNYWTATETYEALKIYMDMDFDGLREDIVQMPGGERIRVNTRSFRNDMRNFASKDDVLTLLIHLGYLGYDSERAEAFIPNKEIIGEFENAMSVGGWPEVMKAYAAVQLCD